jgi:putative ATPase subunit gpP of terminase
MPSVSTVTTRLPDDNGEHRRDGRPRVPIARWAAPDRIDLDPEHQWLWWSGGARPTLVRAGHDLGEELLERFVRLADASADEIAGFARRWGLLGSHDLGNYPDLLDRAEDSYDHVAAGLTLLTQWRRHGREPLAAWRCWSQHAGALLRVSDELRHGRVGRPRDVAMVCRPSPTADTWPDVAGLQPWWLRRPDHAPPAPTLRNHRELVEVFVARWITAGHVRPMLRWTAKEHTVELSGRGLLGALAANLLAAVHGTTSLAVCSGCSGLYLPTRTPRNTQRHFCGPCRANGEPLRYAKRDSRARAQARRLAHKGWSVTRIATLLSQTKDTINTWLARARPRRRRPRSR